MPNIKIDISLQIGRSMIKGLKDKGLISDKECQVALDELEKIHSKEIKKSA